MSVKDCPVSSSFLEKWCLMSHLCHVSASAQSSSCSTTFSTLLILAVLLCLPVGRHHLWSAALKLGEVLEMSVWRSAENKRVTYNFHGQCFSTGILYICKYIYIYLYTYVSLSISLLLCKSVMLSESIQLMNHKNLFYSAAHLYFWSLPSDDENLSLCDSTCSGLWMVRRKIAMLFYFSLLQQQVEYLEFIRIWTQLFELWFYLYFKTQ